MFWSGNYITVREANSLLKEENVTLTQILEADDILQECKADKAALVQYLTSPEILAELITLITEEPSKELELQMQYQHASMACEVLSSNMSTMSDRLSSNFVQMNRLCDFINKEPPLNSLLASFFSKTVEMLLERSPKQDCYLYHIVCLRAVDFFKARQDFLPNLLRHISTSAIMDTFKHFMRLEQGFDKVILSWLEEHQFLESLIQIACGSYASARTLSTDPDNKVLSPEGETDEANKDAEDELERQRRNERIRTVGAANAANLLCEIILSVCVDDSSTTRSNVAATLAARLKSADGVALVLRGMFTSPTDFRRHALVNGCQILLALLRDDPILGGLQPSGERSAVELVVAPHLPLLHQALLQDPDPAPHAPYEQQNGANCGSGVSGTGAVGAARLQVATLMGQLAVSEVQEVAGTLVTLGTPATLLDMFFQFPGNNFLHAQVHALVKAALANVPHRMLYARHLLLECDLLTRLMDAFEEDEAKRADGGARSGYMGFALLMAARVQRALEADSALAAPLDTCPDLLRKWNDFCNTKLKTALTHHDTPLGGYYPPENVYEFNDVTADGVEPLQDLNGEDIGEVSGTPEGGGRGEGGGAEDGDGLAFDTPQNMEAARRTFLDMIGDRYDNVMTNMWDDYDDSNRERAPVQLEEEDVQHPLAQQVLTDVSPWETPSETSVGACTEGWADFGGDAFGSADPFATTTPAASSADTDYAFWNYKHMGRGSGTGLENASSEELELANNLLNAMSIMTPEDVRSIMDTSAPSVLAQLSERDTDTSEEMIANPELQINVPSSMDSSKTSSTAPDVDAPAIINSLTTDITEPPRDCSTTVTTTIPNNAVSIDTISSDITNVTETTSQAKEKSSIANEQTTSPVISATAALLLDDTTAIPLAETIPTMSLDERVLPESTSTNSSVESDADIAAAESTPAER
ncbi:hypothetical protein EVAR_62300_1 [Eumeta japonica]|uniref:Serine/threonine-protein phosphatase 6 regulatory subunit 3 n=1 Tax=Eumeta variegata TaxID=151549 RepID=A0A4C1ZEC9_EUMVA|nr:hypothetical protein EVAR_62300_1 [Eumeta japonica]